MVLLEPLEVTDFGGGWVARWSACRQERQLWLHAGTAVSTVPGAIIQRCISDPKRDPNFTELSYEAVRMLYDVPELNGEVEIK